MPDGIKIPEYSDVWEKYAPYYLVPEKIRKVVLAVQDLLSESKTYITSKDIQKKTKYLDGSSYSIKTLRKYISEAEKAGYLKTSKNIEKTKYQGITLGNKELPKQEINHKIMKTYVNRAYGYHELKDLYWQAQCDICEEVEYIDSPEIYTQPIKYLGIPKRILKSLEENRIYKIGNLFDFEEKELEKFKGLGKKAVQIILSKLKDYGILEEWLKPEHKRRRKYKAYTHSSIDWSNALFDVHELELNHYDFGLQCNDCPNKEPFYYNTNNYLVNKPREIEEEALRISTTFVACEEHMKNIFRDQYSGNLYKAFISHRKWKENQPTHRWFNHNYYCPKSLSKSWIMCTTCAKTIYKSIRKHYERKEKEYEKKDYEISLYWQKIEDQLKEAKKGAKTLIEIKRYLNESKKSK